MKKDDFSLPHDQRQEVRFHADRLLREAKAYDISPTPLDKIVSAARLEVKYIQDLLPRNGVPPEKIKKALAKLQGLLHREENTIYIDKALPLKRRKFITIHEVAHDWLPEHAETYQILEDSELELDEFTLDDFERSANCFASDVLFQLDRFTTMARDLDFGIGAPIKQLNRHFGTGLYSTLRRYTLECGREAALLVCDGERDREKPLHARRYIPSPQFEQRFGSLEWPDVFGTESFFFQNRPANKFLIPTPWLLLLPSGESIACEVEGYDSSRQIFFFIYPARYDFRIVI